MNQAKYLRKWGPCKMNASCFWLVPLFKTICINCGAWWIFWFPKCSDQLNPSITGPTEGLMDRLSLKRRARRRISRWYNSFIRSWSHLCFEGPKQKCKKVYLAKKKFISMLDSAKFSWRSIGICCKIETLVKIKSGTISIYSCSCGKSAPIPIFSRTFSLKMRLR